MIKKQADRKNKLEQFLKLANNATFNEDIFLLRNWTAQEEYFEMLKTDVLSILSRHTRKQLNAGGDYAEMKLLLYRILSKRYLLSGRFEKFQQLTETDGIEIPAELEQFFDNYDDSQEPYSSHILLIKVLANLRDDEFFDGIRRDVRAQFVEKRISSSVAATVEHAHPLVRPAITFLIACDKNRKVMTTQDIFLSAQKIDEQFRQTAEEIQHALSLTNEAEIQHWYRLDVFQNLVRNGEISLNGRSAGAAIGWLIFSIEEDICLPTPLMSIWGEYNAYHKRFSQVASLQDKLLACIEDGIRIVAVPEATLKKQLIPDTTFEDYAKQHGVHLIAFPDQPIFKVYSYILEKYQALELESLMPDYEQYAENNSRQSGTNKKGKLFKDRAGEFYWGQRKKYHIPNLDLIEQMKVHQMPGWKICKKVNLLPHISGPPLYFTDFRSNGLLIKSDNDNRIFLILNGKKKEVSSEYSFENYRFQGRLLEWEDVVSLTSEIVNEFPTGSTITIKPKLSQPVNGAELNESTVTLCSEPHPNKIWEYHFQISDSKSVTTRITPYSVDDRVVYSPRLVVENLSEGEYFWRMRGIKYGRLPSAWSETWSFTVSD